MKLPDRISGRKNLILASTGSIASLKIPLLIQRLKETQRYQIILLPTPKSLSFFSSSDLNVPILTDEDDWRWTQRGDSILHIELRRWVDVLLIAPMSANQLAKISMGMCDSLLLCVLRAWDYSSKEEKQLVCAPAMNTSMYLHPFTQPQLRILEEMLRFKILPPVEKQLMCGDTGVGAMMEVEDIVAALALL